VLSSPTAGRGFVAAGGTSREAVAAALDPACPPSALVAGLLALSQLARASPEAAAALATGGGGSEEGRGGERRTTKNDDGSRDSTTPFHLVRLLSHPDPGVRGRAASLAGNLARHSGDHYGEMRAAGLVAALISALKEEEEEEGDEKFSSFSSSPSSSSSAAATAAALYSVKKFAAFALGNAAFHSAALYPELEAGIAPLVALLRQGGRKEKKRKAGKTAITVNDGKAAANAAGALGNLARNSPLLARALADAGAPQALIEVAEEEAREGGEGGGGGGGGDGDGGGDGGGDGDGDGGGDGDGDGPFSSPPSAFEPRDGGSPLAVALFSLGTMVAHRPLFDPASTLRRCEASERLGAALDSLDRRVARWRREFEERSNSPSQSCPSPPPATTVVEKYAARVRAKLEAASRAS